MLVEQLIFTIIAFALFVNVFWRMIKNNDTIYVVVLVLEAIGIALNFIEVISGTKTNIIFLILKYILSVIIPLFVIILERKNISLIEISNITIAKIFLTFGQDKKAKQILINLASKIPESYNAHKLLAELYEKEGGRRKAIDEYVQAIDIDKQDFNSYYKVAKLLDELDKKDEAAEMLTTLLNKKPEMYEATQLLGDILISKEMYKEAVNIYQEALRYNPTSFDINYNLGIAYTMLNDFQNAKTCYEKAAQINTMKHVAKYSLAEIALIYKDIEEAEKRFLEAVEDEELSADGYYELAKIYLIKGDKDTAIKYITIAIDSNSKKIVEKMKKDPIFIPILSKIAIPFNLENTMEEKESKLTKTEISVKEYLEEMSEITRNLGYNDIKFLKKYKTNYGIAIEEKEKKEEPKIQKEIQE